MGMVRSTEDCFFLLAPSSMLARLRASSLALTKESAYACASSGFFLSLSLTAVCTLDGSSELSSRPWMILSTAGASDPRGGLGRVGFTGSFVGTSHLIVGLLMMVGCAPAGT